MGTGQTDCSPARGDRYAPAASRRYGRAFIGGSQMTTNEKAPCGGRGGGVVETRGECVQPPRQADTITIYPRGVNTCGWMPRMGLPDGAGGVRGQISGWSAASRRRLRKWLLENEAVSGVVYGVTLTVPGDIIAPEEWRRLLNLFSQRLIRAKVGCVWRLELQQRGQPHLHCLMAEGVAGRPAVDFYWWLKCLWLDVIDTLPPCDGRIYDPARGVVDVQHCPRSVLLGAYEHAVDVETDNGDVWYRYICDHTSKRKHAQIHDWQGFRHWGIIYKAAFRPAPALEVVVHNRWHYAPIYRQLRRMSARRIRDDRAPFGYRLGRSPRRYCGGSAVWFGVSPADVERLLRWAETLPPPR